MKSRADCLRASRDQTFDLCVIGGGATGAGCAVDAQLRGLRTVLIDAGDFASATSSASTKLAHGGIRYLQQAFQQFDFGQFKVVRSALHERARMLRNAPQLAHEAHFLIPCFSAWESLYYGTGVRFYDWLSGSTNLSSSSRLSRAMALRRLPNLNPAKLWGAVVYSDGQFDDARFCLSLVQTFQSAGGIPVNHLKLIGFEKSEDGIRLQRAKVQDQVSGERFTIAARAFLNATGPFSDTVRSLAHAGIAPRLVLSRGVHILLPLAQEDSGTALLVPHTDDSRVIFAIPWLGRLLVGTTDQEVDTAAEAAVTREEAEYLLRHLNRYLARPRTVEEIVSAFSGVRPLVRGSHTRSTSKLIRDHEVEVDERTGLISILGGKWTSYRVMAEDAVNRVERSLGRPESECRTASLGLEGAVDAPARFAARLADGFHIPAALAFHLTQKYGANAEFVCEMARAEAGLDQALIAGFPAIHAEVAYSIRGEMALTIEDVLARRLGLQYYSWAMAAEAAPAVADHLTRHFEWSAAERSSALEAYIGKIRRMQAAFNGRSS